MIVLNLSSLPHTWIIDLDGTIVKHNGYKEGPDLLLPGVIDFWRKIPFQDMIILVSARSCSMWTQTASFLDLHGLRYNHIILGLPVGERVLVNDMKPSGLITAHAVNLQRDGGLANVHLGVQNIR